MSFPTITSEAWRAQVEKELAGKPFEKTLVHETIEGLSIAPLYTEAPALPRVLGDGAPFRVCMRHGDDATAAAIHEDLEGGADALWLTEAAARALPAQLPPHVRRLVDEGERAARIDDVPVSLVSTIDAHTRGADATFEIALALAGVAARLRASEKPLLVRAAVGRDTFVELCKLRALRLCVRKLLTAANAPARSLTLHAVASSRTLAARDPWVNMLRVTTEVFAAVLGGADWVTPLAFDDALDAPSALGRRVARNTGHVLREESGLGRVVDPGAGSYYLDALTDALAREAWERFRAIEREGGIDAPGAVASIERRLEETRAARAAAIAKRKMPVLGVSEFANLGEKLPSAPRHDATAALRDDAPFEALRAKLEAKPPSVLLVTVGEPAEARPRVSFMKALFATVGVAAKEATLAEARARGCDVACLCGSDEAYAKGAVGAATELASAGVRRLALAGRPGALEGELRGAGVQAFVFLGADVISALDALLRVSP
jgi:methylmalonyl-CoA mutase